MQPTADIMAYARQARDQMRDHLRDDILNFWLSKAVDKPYGGYLTYFDGDGRPWELTDKYIVTQTRMIWGLSLFSQMFPDDPRIRAALEQGVDFFLQFFWDMQHGGWFWSTRRNGDLLDDGKVVYGQSFALYALAQYGLSTGDCRGRQYAEKTFDLLQIHCADTLRGGYYENLERDWGVSEGGFAAGDRKSLDIHMHLMEAFTALYELTGEEIHRRKLLEVTELILRRMVHPQHRCGLNQFDLDFHPIPAIAIRRTWNAERPSGETITQPQDTTSYGHNVELLWLANKAAHAAGLGEALAPRLRGLVDHALQYGVDWQRGGVYRDGPHAGPPLVRDKEWWQNCEALVGFLDAYLLYGDRRYFDAFRLTWEFDKRHMIRAGEGEWMQLVREDGTPICSDLGNPWKAIYHTGRAMAESIQRLDGMLRAHDDPVQHTHEVRI